MRGGYTVVGHRLKVSKVRANRSKTGINRIIRIMTELMIG